jgi:hypothetical protein
LVGHRLIVVCVCESSLTCRGETLRRGAVEMRR